MSFRADREAAALEGTGDRLQVKVCRCIRRLWRIRISVYNRDCRYLIHAPPNKSLDQSTG
jgi:hypothetical protein